MDVLMLRAGKSITIVAGLSMVAPMVAAEQAPYAGWETCEIKALSTEQIDDLRTGRGMGMALPAELNGYPGPRHVLDLAQDLALTSDQQAQAQALFDEMEAQAVVLGEQVIAGEAALDRLFGEQTASDESVRLAAIQLGGLQGELRAHHLRYHLATRDLLRPHQLMRYAQLRGYEGAAAGGHGAGHHHGAAR